jgi:hypothetical protein
MKLSKTNRSKGDAAFESIEVYKQKSELLVFSFYVAHGVSQEFRE